MILSAGEGTRLRPLTYSLPKPMVPVANRPVLEYTLQNLKKCGITQVIINLSYKAEHIQNYFGNGSNYGMQIQYSLEKELLGTAGGVKKVEPYLLADPDPDFLITSGDGITNFDFSRLISFHRKKKSVATMGLKKVESKFEYGVTFIDKNSRIKKFVEKPSWGDVFSNVVNTGNYVFSKTILKEIPKNKFFDFGKQVWPRLLKKKKPIFGLEFRDYWTDIGNLTEYFHAQKAVLDRLIAVQIPGSQAKPTISP